jgi:hypothetical protein
MCISNEERAMLIELFGEQAVKRHPVFLANYMRIFTLFPKQPPTPEQLRRIRGERP